MRRAIWASGEPVFGPPHAGSPINPASQQADGLYIHFPFWDSQDGRLPYAFRDPLSDLWGISGCGAGTLAIAQDPITGYWLPSFPGTGQGNTSVYIGISKANNTVAAFAYSNDTNFGEITTPISISIWFKVTAFTNTNAVLTAQHIPTYTDPYLNFRLMSNSDGSVDFELCTGGVGTYSKVSSPASIVTTGVWCHAVGTYDGTTMKIAVNGKVRNTATAGTTGKMRIGSNSWSVGANPQLLFGSQTFNGLIMDLRVYSRVVGDYMIADMYNNRWGLWQEDQRAGLKAGAVLSPTATSTINLSGSAFSGANARSSLNLSVMAMANQSFSKSATNDLILSARTHTQNVPESATGTLNLSVSANAIRTWVKSAASTINLSPTSSGRNTILRVSAITHMNLGGGESGGSDFVESLTSRINVVATSSGRSDKVSVSAINTLNLSASSYRTGVDYAVYASSDLFLGVVSTGGRAYSASATNSFIVSASATSNSLARSTLNLSVTANAFREVGPATSTLSLSVTASASVELPDNGNSINKAYYTGLSTEFPVHFAETPDGLLLIANGIDPVLRWDGISRSFYPAGMIAPSTALTLGSSGSGTLSGTYTAYVRFIDAQGNVSNLSPISNEISISGKGQINYTDVPVPTEGRVTGRQILRNTSGQATTYYVDIDTTDLVSTSFSSTRSDSDLAAQESVPLIDSDSNIIANLYAPPPSYRSVVASHLNRMFLAADVEYKTGMVQVTKGSTTVRGVGTRWPDTLAGRELFVVSATKTYSIASVDVVNQTLTLESTYTDESDLFGVYAIRAPLALRKLIYYSESGLPEAWPVTNTISIQEDGDDITGLFVRGSYLFIVEKRHTYKFTFQDDPATDGFVFPSAQRGSINQRCIVNVEDATYMLDEWGVHRISADESSESVSAAIQTLFRPGYNDAQTINWSADTRLWHAAHSPTQDTVRWFVSMSGSREPRHAICFNYRQDRWWVEEYTCKVTGSTVASIGHRRSIVGADTRRILAIETGTLDGVSQNVGTTYGYVTSSGQASITKAGAEFIAPGIVNAPVWISQGAGVGQGRRVVEIDGETLILDRPWAIRPDTTSFFQVGGIHWTWKSGWFRYLDGEETNNRSMDLGFQTLDNDAFASMQMYIDYSSSPRVWSINRSSDGVVTTKGSSDVSLRLSQDQGYVVFRYDGHSEQYARGDSVVSLRIQGVQGVDQTIIYYVRVNGVQ